jgi:hypothetical protein
MNIRMKARTGAGNAAKIPWRRWSLIALLSFASAAISQDKTGEKVLYRYKNDKGVTAIDDHVPPEFVKNGYEVLTRDLRVIQVIPRQLTGEEGKRQRQSADAARQQAAWDKRLLLRYSTPRDIEEARDRALAEFDVRLSILQSNLRTTKAQVEDEQSRAADIERRGQAVPAPITTNIAALKKELGMIEDSIKQQRNEKDASRRSYERDIDRFKTLQDVVDRRRQATQAEPE